MVPDDEWSGTTETGSIPLRGDDTATTTVFLDAHGDVLHYAPVDERLIGLRPSDIGAPLAQLADRIPQAVLAQVRASITGPRGALPVSIAGTGRDGIALYLTVEPAVLAAGRDRGAVLTVRRSVDDARVPIDNLMARLSLALNAANIGIWDYDFPNDHLDWDERMFALYDVDPAHFGHRFEDWRRCVHVDDLPDVIAQWQSAIATGTRFAPTFRVFHRDGSTPLISTAAVFIRDAAGYAVRAVGANFDVTEVAHTEWEHAFLFDHANDLQIVAGMDGVFRRVSKAWTTRLGWSEEDLLSRPFIDLVHPDDRAATLAAMDRLAWGESVSDFENRYRHVDGSYRRLWWNASPLPGYDMLVASARDVTESHALREALRHSEAQFRAIFDTAPIGIAVVDDQGRPALSNAALQAILGIDGETLAKTPFPEFTHPEDVDKDVEQYTALLAGEIHYYTMEKRYIRPDGEVVWGSLTVTLFDDDPPRALGMVVDITERRRAEAALLESEANYRSIAERLPGVVFKFVREADGETVRFDYASVNELSARVIGFTAEALMRDVHSYLGAIVPEDFARYSEVLLRSAETMSAYEIEFRIRRPTDGAIVWLNARATPHRRANGAIVWTGIALDVTERKQATEALEGALADLKTTNAALEHFAYAASHDLREPLNTVSNYASLLTIRYAEQLDDHGHIMVNYMFDATERMKALVRALLEYSRVGSSELVIEPVDVGALVGEVLADLDHRLRETRAEIDAELEVTVHADRIQLGRVFANLIGNALKYRRAGVAPVVSISVEDLHTHWRFAVQDNGIGIDQKYAERVFEIFRQLHHRDEYDGIGLGLALCKRIVQRHGGEIWFESQIGQGSTFFFTIRKPASARTEP